MIWLFWRQYIQWGNEGSLSLDQGLNNGTIESGKGAIGYKCCELK